MPSSTPSTGATTITEHEAEQVERANATGTTPVVFVHGLWLLPSSWDRWAAVFEEAGYAALTPGWPDDPTPSRRPTPTPRSSRTRPSGRSPTTSTSHPPARQEAGRHRALLRRAADADPRRPRARRPSRWRSTRRRSAACCRCRSPRSVGLARCSATRPTATAPCRSPTSSSATAFANAVSEDEAKELYETYAVPAPGAPLFQAATANLNPWTEAKVDTKNPDRGPLLIISGEKDHTVPWAIANASFKQQQRNEASPRSSRCRTAGTR